MLLSDIDTGNVNESEQDNEAGGALDSSVR